jgi:alpha/beta superfamily hydrolase
MPPLAVDDIVVESVRFPSGLLMLEGRLAYPTAAAVRGAALIAGPHPLLGGDMRNNVIEAILNGLGARGNAVLTFNYRGIGDSEGDRPDVGRHLAEFWKTSHVDDETDYVDDLIAAAEFLQDVAGKNLPLSAIGYSFGCSILPYAKLRQKAPMVLIAPTVGTHDYDGFADLPNPLLVIAPDGDFAADSDQLARWFADLKGPTRLLRGMWDDHFFRGHEERLTEIVADYLDEHWGNIA